MPVCCAIINSRKRKEREDNNMTYTVKMINNYGRTVEETKVTNLNDAIKMKKRNNVNLVGVRTVIIDDTTGREVRTTNNYYGNTRVYRNNYIKMY